MPEKEKFADSGEFAGLGVPDSGSMEEGWENGQAGAGENQAGAEGEGAGQEKAAADSDNAGQAEAGRAEAERGDGGKAEEDRVDPLDLPISKWEGVDLGLGEVAVDKVVMAGFAKTCMDLKLSPRQAAGLAQFQLKAVEDARLQLTEQSVAELQKEWGRDAGGNQQAIVNLVSRVDQALGNEEFSQALQQSGVACYAAFARGLLAMTRMMSEDSLGAVGKSGGSGRDETAEEGLREVFAASRRG